MARKTALVFLLTSLLSAPSSVARADESAVLPDSLRTYATLHSLGFEWDVTGDSDHDATCGVRYRVSGTSAWRDGLDLLRVDYDGYYADTRADRAYDMLAGSLFFLEPSTVYEVELDLEDPDGGDVRRTVELATRPEPVLPRGSVAYVHADTVSGDGTRERPLALADALARKASGLTYCLLPGQSISRVADGISYAQRNVDIFGNDIFDTSDDGIEPDYGYANIRIWGNRIANVQYHAFSFQGMYCGPWYFARNQVTTARGALFKFRTTDRLVFVNNTLVAPTFGRDIMHHLLHSLARNNLFIRDGDEAREPWRARLKYRGKSKERGYYTPDPTAPDWRTDWDYSGYDLRGPDGDPGAFFWFDESYDSVQDLAAAAGIEAHGRQIDRQTTFVDYRSPTHPARQPRPILLLDPDGDAGDAGEPVANLAEEFTGSAPDLGAWEIGAPSPHFGPREPDDRGRWLLH